MYEHSTHGCRSVMWTPRAERNSAFEPCHAQRSWVRRFDANGCTEGFFPLICCTSWLRKYAEAITCIDRTHNLVISSDEQKLALEQQTTRCKHVCCIKQLPSARSGGAQRDDIHEWVAPVAGSLGARNVCLHPNRSPPYCEHSCIAPGPEPHLHILCDVQPRTLCAPIRTVLHILDAALTEPSTK